MKMAVAVVVGAAIGLGLSYLSRRIGGHCIFLCNPWVAAVLGGLVGLSFVYGSR